MGPPGWFTLPPSIIGLAHLTATPVGIVETFLQTNEISAIRCLRYVVQSHLELDYKLSNHAGLEP